jgi:hypothetical protein
LCPAQADPFQTGQRRIHQTPPNDLDLGAGPTGVELAGQIREVATKTLRREYRHIKPEDARVLLFDVGAAPLATFGPKLSALAARDLGKLGVELHMGSIVTHVDLNGLDAKGHDGKATRYEAGNVLWTAGVEAPPLATAVAKATGAEQDRAGRIVVGKDLSVPGHPEILVTGDMMSLDKLPGVAEVAMQTGLYAGRRIGQEVRGRSFDKPFKYRDLGSAAHISRGKAVVSAFKLNSGGFLGWWVWLFIHIAFLTGLRNRVGAVLGWWFAFTRDIRRERTFTIDDMQLAEAYRGIKGSHADSPASLAVCGSTISVPASVTRASGPVLLGRVNGTPCTADTVTGQVTHTRDADGVTLGGATISGPARITGNSGRVTVSGNTIGGPASITGNTGATLVAGNLVNGALSCSGNHPAPTDGGKPNTSNGPAAGQCSSLS